MKNVKNHEMLLIAHEELSKSRDFWVNLHFFSDRVYVN